MEYVCGRMDMRLCQTEEKFRTYNSRALCRGYHVFGPELVGVELLKSEVLLNKPVFIGQAVLDLSKFVRYKLRYEQLAKYARQFEGDIRIAGGDTDSFFLEVKYSMIGVYLGCGIF